MKFTLRSASSAALLIGLAGTFPAFAQDTVSGPQPPAEASDEGDRVVVTGSLIAGSPEDAALPVEVFSAADLEEQGAPTALEFAKDLTIGPSFYLSQGVKDVVVLDPHGLTVLHARKDGTRRLVSEVDIDLECGCSCRV